MRFARFLVSLILFCSIASAHVGNHPSVHDTAASILERLRKEKTHAELKALTVAQVERFLTPQERQILGTEHFSFKVNVPVTVSVIRYTGMATAPFWFDDAGFKKASYRVKLGDHEYDVWEKDFPAGWIGLGVNSITGGGRHYFVSLRTREEAEIQVSDIYPGQATVGEFKKDEKPYVDTEDKITAVPSELDGSILIRTVNAWREVARLLNVFLFTQHPSSRRPDHVLLTWSDDPKTTQTIQWRTGPKVKRGYVAYQKKAAFDRFKPKPLRMVRARTERIISTNLLNDAVIQWHSVTLRDLDPGTTYVYSVGTEKSEDWTELAEFTTAPEGVEPFSFIYMGDAQNGLDRWGSLVKNAYRKRPDAAFYIMAGDLVNRGADRDDWDSLFHNAAGVYDRRTLVPAIGNHECQGGHPGLYLKFFDLPKNGPTTCETERAYAFEYSNALFIVLDSNLAPETQTAWLDQQLSRSKATWKFVIYHHPAYSSAPSRDNKTLRDAWGPLFDKYHVDLALQGHDHAYLRTYPMKKGKRAASAKEGTVYIVSVSGTKMYKQDPRDYTEFGMTNVATYQVLDIQISGDRLVYRAYDIDGRLRDELIIEK
jgi:acid phosphatase type 7